MGNKYYIFFICFGYIYIFINQIFFVKWKIYIEVYFWVIFLISLLFFYGNYLKLLYNYFMMGKEFGIVYNYKYLRIKLIN